jgi:outer membrane protein
MTRSAVRSSLAALVALLLASTAHAQAQVLTADQAVAIALKQNPQVVLAKASVLQARASLYSAYSGVLPTIEASWTRSGQEATDNEGNQIFGNQPVNSASERSQNYGTTPEISGRWNVLDLSAIKGWRAAGHGMDAAKLGERSTRQLAVLDVKRQFYSVVRQVRLALVADAALKLARDNERRVRALFEVGSVARNDLLRARLSTSQSELDSLVSHQQVVVQRDLLASLLGIPESQLGEVDTALVVAPRTYDQAAILEEASRQRPDIQAAEAQFRAAQGALGAANFARLPYVSVNGGAQLEPKNSRDVFFGTDAAGNPITESSHFKSERVLFGSVSINLPIFTGMATESRIASARAGLVRAEENRDALRRNLAAEVNEALISYRAAVEGDRVSADAVESALENLKLVQQKYNVGSSTILDLIDAQVSTTRAAADRQRTLAAIRVAEAEVDRVRGLGD